MFPPPSFPCSQVSPPIAFLLFHASITQSKEWRFSSSSAIKIHHKMGFPVDSAGKEHTCQNRRHNRQAFNPWVRKISWRRKWQPTSVFLLGKFYGQGSLAGCSPRDCKELDMTEHPCMHTQPKTVPKYILS